MMHDGRAENRIVAGDDTTLVWAVVRDTLYMEEEGKVGLMGPGCANQNQSVTSSSRSSENEIKYNCLYNCTMYSNTSKQCQADEKSNRRPRTL